MKTNVTRYSCIVEDEIRSKFEGPIVEDKHGDYVLYDDFMVRLEDLYFYVCASIDDDVDIDAVHMRDTIEEIFFDSGGYCG